MQKAGKRDTYRQQGPTHANPAAKRRRFDRKQPKQDAGRHCQSCADPSHASWTQPWPVHPGTWERKFQGWMAHPKQPKPPPAQLPYSLMSGREGGGAQVQQCRHRPKVGWQHIHTYMHTLPTPTRSQRRQRETGGMWNIARKLGQSKQHALSRSPYH